MEKIEEYNRIIEDLKSLLRNNRLIGNKLIEIYDDNDFFNFINDRAEKILIYNFSKPYLTVDESYEIIISLSYIALKCYKGNFWDNVEKQYTKLYSMSGMKSQKIRSKIVDILKDFRGNDKRYIEYPIKNAIVPYAFIDKYFDFMFDIYKINFKCSLPDNIEDEMRDIFIAIYEKINADSDELNIEVTNKTYKLIKSTQNIIKNEENLTELCELSAKVLQHVQAYLWNHISPFENNTYFNTSFERFLQTGNLEKRKLTEREKSDYVSRWKPTFRLIDNEVYLITPIHKIPERYDPSKIDIWVYNNDDIISIEEKPIVEQGIGYYVVNPKNIKVDKPLGNLSYMISESKNEIYNSSSNLYRDYILFNEEGHEIKLDTDYDGICSIVFNDLTINGIEIIKNKEFYDIGTIRVKQGNCFTLNDGIITFTGKVNNTIDGIKQQNAKAKVKENYIDVYENVRSIIFNCNSDINHIILEINGNSKRLNELDYKISSLNKSIQLDISDICQGYYNLKIFDFVEKKNIFCKEFVVDPININCEKLQKRKFLMKIKSSLLGYVERTIDLDYSLNANISFENNREIIEYELQINIPLYKIDDKKYCELDDYIWSNSLNNYSKVECINFTFDKLEVRDDKQINIGLPLDFVKEQSIIDAQILKNYNDRNEFYIYLKNSKKNSKYILWILNSCKLIENETFTNYDKTKNELVVYTSYIGNTNIYMRIKNQNDNVIFEREITGKNDIYTNNKLYSKINYTIEYVEKQSTSIFFNSEKIIGSRQVFFMKYTDLIDRYCKINSIRYDDYKHNVIDKELILNNTFVLFNKLLSENLYLGEIYKMNFGEKIIFESVNPVIIEILSKNYNDVVRCIITTQDEDGLLYDVVNRIFEADGNDNCILANDYDIALIRRKYEV